MSALNEVYTLVNTTLDQQNIRVAIPPVDEWRVLALFATAGALGQARCQLRPRVSVRG